MGIAPTGFGGPRQRQQGVGGSLEQAAGPGPPCRNAESVATAQGGAMWYPATVRAVLKSVELDN